VTEIYTVKRIDNSRLVRAVAPGRFRECCRLVALTGVLAAGGLLYAWQHFQCIQLGYQLEELKAERGQAAELNQQLKLEAAALRAPMRIDAIARRQLGLTVPVPGQVAPAPAPNEAVLAHAHSAAPAPAQ
jgi:cell division protein FtsL